MKCDSCMEEVPEDNINRVCAYQLEENCLDYKGALTCNCCDKCRNYCHEGLFEDDSV